LSERDEILARLKALLETASTLDDQALLPEMQVLVQDMQRAQSAATIAGGPASFHGMIGSCPALLQVQGLCKRFAMVSAPVLVRGESGTGKDLVAKAIHELSPRADKPFVSENCAAIPETLLESVLFGHVRGAFTGAVRDHPGHFVAADKGTLFLDEIGDMPLAMQVKLLRVLQERTFERVGSNKSIAADARIVAATHSDLEESIAIGRFREDLYYRLNVFPMEMPTLRSRVEDLPLLVNDLVNRTEHEKLGTIRITPAAMDSLCRYQWPGNVRELANLIERLVILFPYGTVDAQDLPERYRVQVASGGDADAEEGAMAGTSLAAQQLPSEGLDLKEHMNKLESMFIVQALDEAGGIVAHAARRLRMGRTTLVEKMRKLGIRRHDTNRSDEQVSNA